MEIYLDHCDVSKDENCATQDQIREFYKTHVI